MCLVIFAHKKVLFVLHCIIALCFLFFFDFVIKIISPNSSLSLFWVCTTNKLQTSYFHQTIEFNFGRFFLNENLHGFISHIYKSDKNEFEMKISTLLWFNGVEIVSLTCTRYISSFFSVSLFPRFLALKQFSI